MSGGDGNDDRRARAERQLEELEALRLAQLQGDARRTPGENIERAAALISAAAELRQGMP